MGYTAFSSLVYRASRFSAPAGFQPVVMETAINMMVVVLMPTFFYNLAQIRLSRKDTDGLANR
jgi:hypothetical protein